MKKYIDCLMNKLGYLPKTNLLQMFKDAPFPIETIGEKPKRKPVVKKATTRPSKIPKK